jgi:hypothetical protein
MSARKEFLKSIAFLCSWQYHVRLQERKFMKQKDKIKIAVKLFGDLDKDLGIQSYDHFNGHVLMLKQGTRFWKVLKMIRLKKRRYYSFIIEGEDVGLLRKMKDGDRIQCFKPVGGG